jgi:serine/threonine-protein kinase
LASVSHQELEARRLEGTTLSGKWTLDTLIGMGGMASVYAASHRNGRRAAVKVLAAEFSHIAQVRERFLREGYVANRIGHPGVVGILDDDTTESGQVYLVMELLEGESFLERINRRSLNAAQTVFVAQQVLEPLATAHRRGIIHRDIKPGNVFVCKDGRVKVLDFGLARVLEGNDLEPTRDGLVLGTVPYLSPEQAIAKRDAVDWRSDIYGVGAMLFYALSGHYVHEANNQLDMLLATIKQPARSLATVLPGASPGLIDLVDRALKYEPAARWQCAEDMGHAAKEVYQELTDKMPRPAQGDEVAQPSRAGEGPEGVDVVLTDASLCVSMVFEPDPGKSPLPPVDPKK